MDQNSVKQDYESTELDKTKDSMTIKYITKQQMDDSMNLKHYAKQPIDKIHQRYPYCIVWTPLPLISYIFPFIGHTGICTSDGKIHDFAGSFYISIDNMAFGEPHKYVFLNSDLKNEEVWDDCIDKADDKYRTEEHNLCCNNCHSHVAHALNLMKYNNKSDYNMINIWWLCLVSSKYVSWTHVIKTYTGFVILILIWLLFSSI